MEYNHPGPRVHSTFRNQPSYTYFNKSIADPKDNVYLLLNEIDAHFMEPQQLADKRGFENVTIIDPRNQKLVTDILYDYTTKYSTKVFYSPRPSSLNFAQHSIGMRVVKARQEGTELAEDDYLIWHKMESKFLKETQEFQKYVYEYHQTNKEVIYAPARMLMDLYKLWYGRKAEKLLKRYSDLSYNTHLGLPHVRVCKEALKEQWAEIVEVQVKTEMNLSMKPDQMDLKQVKRNLEIFFQNYVDSESRKEEMEDSTKNEFVKSLGSTEGFPLFYIPLDSLLFLLTAGDYVDLPMEMLLDIKEKEGDSEEKYIIMDLPLPARQMGWHTWQLVVESGATAYLCRSSEQQQKLKDQEEDNAMLTDSQESIPYVLKTIEDYMESLANRDGEHCKFSQSCTKWQLKAKDKDLIQHIHTIIPTNLAIDSIKLEYKPKFGCELQTKYELLRAWLKLKLLNNKSSTCHRLDVNNFQTLLAERQTLEKLQFQLSTTYHIQIPQLLSNLYEFLNLLTQMPCGHYMLRYNPKFRDKFMLCKPSEEITQNTTNIHQLLKTEPSELLFMSQQSYLPIADNLCSLMHVQHKLIPCTFRPLGMKHRDEKLTKKLTKSPINDRKLILEKIEMKKKSARDHLNAMRKTRKKKAQRANKRKRAQQQQQQNGDENGFQKEMELDQQIVGH
ncbi:little elongation complex subunit 2 [Musca vetustissima]|uniref:little elongation complex subunit 2 n=1 Tax=Musca vetustissima TaxID=27455 RepID=UPI002AB6B9ED|nr:little elongation complex subunit 2 [Musca vetustissima]